MKRKSHIDLLKALDSDVEEKDILGYDYLPAQTLAMNEQVENRLFKRVGRNSYGEGRANYFIRVATFDNKTAFLLSQEIVPFLLFPVVQSLGGTFILNNRNLQL